MWWTALQPKDDDDDDDDDDDMYVCLNVKTKLAKNGQSLIKKIKNLLKTFQSCDIHQLHLSDYK